MSTDGTPLRAPTLTTERLCLRQIRTDDAEALFAVCSDPEVTCSYGQEPHQTVERTASWIERALAYQDRDESLTWAIALKGRDAAIGECCLWNIDPGRHCAEIGYELGRAHWHQGIMSEALSAVFTWGFTELGLHRIEARPMAANERSRSLLLKLGFRYEGTQRERMRFRGRSEDQLYFGLLSEEWSARPAGRG